MKHADLVASVAGGLDFNGVREEVLRLAGLIVAAHRLTLLREGFGLLEKACRGTLPGYRALSTPYHDERHVLEVTLCCARLLHGLFLRGRQVTERTIDIALLGALFHDIGYLMKIEEGEGSGAQFTLVHVARGIEFVHRQLDFCPPSLIDSICKAISATNHRPGASLPECDDEEERLAVQATGTADLIGQMADREYLERLLLLYLEFREAGIPLFADVHDLLEKSSAFYQVMKARLETTLGNLTPALADHFAAATGQRRNYYLEAIERNLQHLERLVALERNQRFEFLRRGGIAERTMSHLQRVEDERS